MSAPVQLRAESFRETLRERLDGSPLVLLLDVDGTLAPIAATPALAAVPSETQSVLRRLARTPGVTVALVSGRAASDALRLAGVEDVWVIGNHGFERRAPHGTIEPADAVRPFGAIIAAAAGELRSLERDVPGTMVEDKQWTLSVHYRQVPSDRAGEVIAGAHRVAERRGLRVSEGKKVVELRPPVEVNKGTASLALAESAGAFARGASVAYIGDDRTDEDAFRALRARAPSAVTIRVLPTDEADFRDTETAAEFVVASVTDVRRLLEWVAEARADRARA